MLSTSVQGPVYSRICTDKFAKINFMTCYLKSDICQRLCGRKNWVCPDGVPPPVQLYARRAVWEGNPVLWWQVLGGATGTHPTCFAYMLGTHPTCFAYMLTQM